METSIDEQIEMLFNKYIRDVQFDEVEHIPTEFKEFEGEMAIQ